MLPFSGGRSRGAYPESVSLIVTSIWWSLSIRVATNWHDNAPLLYEQTPTLTRQAWLACAVPRAVASRVHSYPRYPSYPGAKRDDFHRERTACGDVGRRSLSADAGGG